MRPLQFIAGNPSPPQFFDARCGSLNLTRVRPRRHVGGAPNVTVNMTLAWPATLPPVFVEVESPGRRIDYLVDGGSVHGYLVVPPTGRKYRFRSLDHRCSQPPAMRKPIEQFQRERVGVQPVEFTSERRSDDPYDRHRVVVVLRFCIIVCVAGRHLNEVLAVVDRFFAPKVRASTLWVESLRRRMLPRGRGLIAGVTRCSERQLFRHARQRT